MFKYGEDSVANDFVRTEADPIADAMELQANGETPMNVTDMLKEQKQLRDGKIRKEVVNLNEFAEINLVEQELPPRDDPIWDEPMQTMQIFQDYLGERFPLTEQNSSADCIPKGDVVAKIDVWQLCAFLPLLRVPELFVIAPTGTGKSWVMSQAAVVFGTQEYLRRNGKRPAIPLDNPPKFIVYVVRNDKQKTNQYREINKNSSFTYMVETHFSEAEKKKFYASLDNPALNPVVDANFSGSNTTLRKIITFMSYAQAGNLLEKNKRAFDEALLVVDEVHEIQDASEASGPRWAPSIRRFENFLMNRMNKPALKRGMLLALTATPFKRDVEGFVTLMNLFCPDGVQPLEKEELMLRPEDLVNSTEIDLNGVVTCGLDREMMKQLPLGRLNGFRLVFYSIDLDQHVYASWLGDPKTLKIRVPKAREPEENKWISKVAKKDWKRYLAGAKDLAIADKKKWGKNGINYVGRQRSIAIEVARTLYAIFRDEESQGIYRKTMLFFPSEIGAKAFNRFFRSVHSQSAYNIVRVSDDDTPAEQKENTALFDQGDENTLLVTNTKNFGTGITFADATLYSQGKSRGPRRIFYVQPDTYALSVQVEGRSRRRCLHAGWQESALSVERIVILPVVVRSSLESIANNPEGGEEMPSCYSIMKQLSTLEKNFVESIAPAAFMSSYTKSSYWLRRPMQLLYVHPDDNRPELSAMKDIKKKKRGPADLETGGAKTEDDQKRGFFGRVFNILFG